MCDRLSGSDLGVPGPGGGGGKLRSGEHGPEPLTSAEREDKLLAFSWVKALGINWEEASIFSLIQPLVQSRDTVSHLLN